jgi:hypothetical protein
MHSASCQAAQRRQRLTAILVAAVSIAWVNHPLSYTALRADQPKHSADVLLTGPKLCYASSGKSIPVSGKPELEDALANAHPGDRIMLAGGVYDGDYVLSKHGTPSEPIVVTAQAGADVVLTGSFKLAGSYGVLAGFGFRAGSINIEGDNNRVTKNHLQDSEKSAVVLRGKQNRIDHNKIERAGAVGIRVLVKGGTVSNRIDHNHIHSLRDGGGYSDLHEAIQVGQGRNMTTAAARTLIESNLLENVRAGKEAEAISVKSSYNVILGNTLMNSRSSLNNRHGNNNLWKNNWIEDAVALRISGDDNEVVGNRAVNANIIIMAGDVSNESGKSLELPNGKGGHPVARRTLVSGNQVDGGKLVLGGEFRKAYPLPAQGTILELNQAEIAEKNHAETVRRDGTTIDPGIARKLSPLEVGPEAPDPVCDAG